MCYNQLESFGGRKLSLNSHSGLTLVGYYGYNNLGDDLLLLSSLEILNEINYKEKIRVTSNGNFDSLVQFFPKKLNIEKVERFPLKVLKAIKSSQITIFGGGNLFQDETSYRSFLYYYYLAKTTLNQKKPFLMMSQGFGPLKNTRAKQKLDTVLKNENTFGIMRDKKSFDYFKNISDNCILQTDYGPYFLKKSGFFSESLKKEKDPELAVIIPKSGICFENLVESLKQIGIKRICAVSFYNHHDETKRKEVEEAAKKFNMEIIEPPYTTDEIINKIAKSSIVISERLHGVVLSISTYTPFVWCDNEKINNFVHSFDPECKFNFKFNDKSIENIVKNSRNYDYSKISDKYFKELQSTVSCCKDTLKDLV